MIADGGLRADTLRVGGFVPFTTTDYPGALAAVIFCQGCPWRCGYCHNPHLVPARGAWELDFAEIVELLGTRRGLLDAVVFSGGEPTAQAVLGDAIRAVRAQGFRIGLHTGGAYPRRVAELLTDLDWVGIDIKAPFEQYKLVTRAAGAGRAAWASLDCVLASGVPCEVRTTVHPTLTPPPALKRVAQELGARGVARWVLQSFRPTGCVDDELVAAARGFTIDEPLVAYLSRYVPEVVVRA
jgi:pyruvate formate lyase activating enzyme